MEAVSICTLCSSCCAYCFIVVIFYQAIVALCVYVYNIVIIRLVMFIPKHKLQFLAGASNKLGD